MVSCFCIAMLELSKYELKNALTPPDEQGGFRVGDNPVSTVGIAYKILARHRNDCRCILCKEAVEVILKETSNRY